MLKAGDLVVCRDGLFFVKENSFQINNVAQDFAYYDSAAGPFIFLYSRKIMSYIEFMFLINGCIMSRRVSIGLVDEFYKAFDVIASIETR